jgi:hypothetical protein
MQRQGYAVAATETDIVEGNQKEPTEEEEERGEEAWLVQTLLRTCARPTHHSTGGGTKGPRADSCVLC